MGVDAVNKLRAARSVQLTPDEVTQYHRLIQALARRSEADPPRAREMEVQLRQKYQSLTLSNGLGKAVYASYSDEQLLETLRQTADHVGHAPTQNEVFFLYRTYLKARFRSWPAALRAVGMRRLPAANLEQPDWDVVWMEEPEICAALQGVSRLQNELGYPPRKRDVTQAKLLCERFRSWENAIVAADAFQAWMAERRSE